MTDPDRVTDLVRDDIKVLRGAVESGFDRIDRRIEVIAERAHAGANAAQAVQGLDEELGDLRELPAIVARHDEKLRTLERIVWGAAAVAGLGVLGQLLQLVLKGGP